MRIHRLDIGGRVVDLVEGDRRSMLAAGLALVREAERMRDAEGGPVPLGVVMAELAERFPQLRGPHR